VFVKLEQLGGVPVHAGELDHEQFAAWQVALVA